MPDTMQCPDTIRKTYLFTLCIAPGVIGYWHLHYLYAALYYLCGYLRFKTEPFFLYLNGLDDLTAEGLVAGLHISKPLMGHEVG